MRPPVRSLPFFQLILTGSETRPSQSLVCRYQNFFSNVLSSNHSFSENPNFSEKLRGEPLGSSISKRETSNVSKQSAKTSESVGWMKFSTSGGHCSKTSDQK